LSTSSYGFSAAERSVLRSLSTPFRIQQFLDDQVKYNKEPDGETCRSPRRVLRDRLGHCMEGALLAAAALRVHGRPPLLMYLESIRDDDHVLAVYTQNSRWGAIAKSNYSGLRSREPVYRNLRELAMSYFEHYYNLAGEKTLRAYSRAIDLSRFDGSDWMTAEQEVWNVSEYLALSRHYPLIDNLMARKLNRMDSRLYEAGKLGLVE
jgi:hypothetical protein